MSDSWLSPGDVADLTTINLQGWSTQAAVSGTESVVFARYSPTLDQQGNAYPYTRVAAQACLVEYVTTRNPRTVSTDAVVATTIDGILTRPVPFDVQTGDLFSLGTPPQEQACIIASVERPELGTQRALFRLRVGEQ